MDLNALKTKRTDLLQQRADALEAATKKYTAGDMTGYNTEMENVKGFNTQLETLDSLISEKEKSFGEEVMLGTKDAQHRNDKAGGSLMDFIRGTEKYANAWMEALKKGWNVENGIGQKPLDPLYDAERASKALSIGGGDTPGEDGGFLVPMDFDRKIIELQKNYIDLSTLVNVQRVNANSGWRAVDTTGTRTPLTKVDELGEFKDGQQPRFKRVIYNCAKYGDKVIVSGELMADYEGIIAYLAEWFTPKYVLTKNKLILDLLNALPFSSLAGATDAEQIKALKSMLNKGLNTAHSKSAVILTNSNGYDVMDGWADANGRAMLVPDPKGGDFERFKNRPVHYADPDEIAAVSVEDVPYDPIYVGNLKAFCTLFLRKGFRIDSTNIGGRAWDTYSTEIRAACRMDAQTVDDSAVKRTGIQAEE